VALAGSGTAGSGSGGESGAGLAVGSADSAKSGAATVSTKILPHRGDKHWSDQQWAIVILVGFTFFALCIAVIMQQVIAWGIVST